MAKFDVYANKKVRRMKLHMGLPEAHVIGLLTCMWNAAHHAAWPVFESADDAELEARWEGEPGKFADAAVACGLLNRDGHGRYIIPNFCEHTFPAVARRLVYQIKLLPDMGDFTQMKFRAMSSERLILLLESSKDSAGFADHNVSECSTDADNVTQCDTFVRPPTIKTSQDKTPQDRSGQAKPRAKTRAQAGEPPQRGGPPTAVGNLAENLAGPNLYSFGEHLHQTVLQETLALAQHGQEWLPWWDAVWRSLDVCGESRAFSDALEHVKTCRDPAVRIAKGNGPLFNPGGYLMDAAQKLLRKHRLPWPDWPGTTRARAAR